MSCKVKTELTCHVSFTQLPLMLASYVTMVYFYARHSLGAEDTSVKKAQKPPLFSWSTQSGGEKQHRDKSVLMVMHVSGHACQWSCVSVVMCASQAATPFLRRHTSQLWWIMAITANPCNQLTLWMCENHPSDSGLGGRAGKAVPGKWEISEDRSRESYRPALGCSRGCGLGQATGHWHWRMRMTAWGEWVWLNFLKNACKAWGVNGVCPCGSEPLR